MEELIINDTEEFSSSKFEKFRSKKFRLLLYPLEDNTHKLAIEYIRNNYDYALITHDKDLSEDGSIKKSHVHVVVSFPNAKWNSAFADELGITPNYIKKCSNLELALEYLIHFNDDTKYQYAFEDVRGTLKNKLQVFISNNGKNELDKLMEIQDFIDSSKFLTYYDIYTYCLTLGYYDIFRRWGAYHWKELINFHNSHFNG